MKKVYFFLIAILAILFYYPSLFYGFSQDDFIHLSASRVNNLGGVLNFFNPFAHFPDIYFYRPLSTQLHFFLNDAIYGLNPLPYHIEALFVHILNAILVYFIVKKIWKSENIAAISAILYVTSAIHFLSLFYISSSQEIDKTFYLFGSIWLFLNKDRNKFFYIFSVVSFVLGLLCKETMIILPFLLISLRAFLDKNFSLRNVWKAAQNIKVFWLIGAIYLATRFIGLLTLFGKGNYHSNFSIVTIFQNLKWYLIWIFGFPEALTYYPSIKPAFLLQFAKQMPFGNLVIGTGVIVIFLFLGLFLSNLIKHKLNIKFTQFLIIWFLISLAPVLPLVDHHYPQYLDTAYLVFIPYLVFLVTSLKSKVFRYLGVLFFLSLAILQWSSINLSIMDHWTTHRAKVADFYHQIFLTDYPNIAAGSRIALIGNKTARQQLSYALVNDYAFKVWYPHKNLDIKYTDSPQLQAINILITKY